MAILQSLVSPINFYIMMMMIRRLRISKSSVKISFFTSLRYGDRSRSLSFLKRLIRMETTLILVRMILSLRLLISRLWIMTF